MNTITKELKLTKTEYLILSELVNKQIQANQTYFNTLRNPDNEHKDYYVAKQIELRELLNKITKLA
jgi:hypothetical protein